MRPLRSPPLPPARRGGRALLRPRLPRVKRKFRAFLARLRGATARAAGGRAGGVPRSRLRCGAAEPRRSVPPFAAAAERRMLLAAAPRLRRPARCLRAVSRPPCRARMDLGKLVSSLDEFASLSLAESWDNVGLLVEPSPPHTVNTLFLTNDLTEEVMEEAVGKRADLVLSYHPPVFAPLKRVTWKTWKERLVVRALEHRIGIYSPHTVYDAIPHGVNNWLTKGLGEILLKTPKQAKRLKLLITIRYFVWGPSLIFLPSSFYRYDWRALILNIFPSKYSLSTSKYPEHI